MNTPDVMPFFETLAEEAALITRHYFRSRLDISRKEDTTPVTIADHQTEQRLRTLIHLNYPEHGIIGEEEPTVQGESEFQWIIDPIDGTQSFICGNPLFATLIAFLYQGEPITSMIDMPILSERWIAHKDKLTLFNDSPAHSANTTLLSRAKLMATSPLMFNRDEWPKFLKLMQKVGYTRFSGDGYLYGMLACGWIDIVVESDLKPYDYMPLKLIVEQAGGVITDWQGQPLGLHSGGQVVACANTVLHSQVLPYLA